MDVVYIVGTGSQWNNLELRYSLRSLYKYGTGFNRVFICGYKPDFISKEVIHIPCVDKYGVNKHRNIYEKLKTAMAYPGISASIFYMHDDHYMLQPFNVNSFGFYKLPATLYDKMKKMISSDGYRIPISNTWTVLNRQKLPVENFNVHCPIVLKNELFLRIMASVKWEVSGRSITHGYLLKSLYCNSLRLDGIRIGDVKIPSRYTEIDIYDRIAHRPFFSSGDGSMSAALRKSLETIYPPKCPAEK